MATNDRFSDLLWMPHCQHKVSKIWDSPTNCINIRLHRVGIPYHSLCQTALENLGFFQIARMKEINNDKYLISALVESWRPKTNTFHLPVGEMTITLQDVSCLWGLPIHGRLITGQADGSWVDMIERLLGIPMEEQHMKQKKRKKEDDMTMVSYSRYSISLSKLRDRFRVMPKNATEREINWYTRALVLDIIGSMVFTDTSGDGVPAMYLQFMVNLSEQTEYNWGAAALSMLYRQLSIASEKERAEISRPLLLQQLWSWSRLPLGRPVKAMKITKEREEEDEQEELDYCPVFGAKWCLSHEFRAPHNAGTISILIISYVPIMCLGVLENPIPYPRDIFEWTGYMPSGPPLARISLHVIKNAAWGIKCAITNSCKKLGKSILRTCLGNLRDLNLEPRLQNMLTDAGLPINIEDIPSDDDLSAHVHHPSPPKDSNSDIFDEWVYSGRGFERYLHAGGIAATQDLGQVTQIDE
ncbi:hypothetical protein OsI_25467 [Oryza sativa Indica Group]|uniref:Aminotransferase-like plant mobile domain-containing protein n=1 Tax=Oryza sativa subsp. indica TaxID=39946 RepID=B8B4T5_ORYSI|nr:hypothetical protein OsI_25467 [Oryza sativa Indica Group]